MYDFRIGDTVLVFWHDEPDARMFGAGTIVEDYAIEFIVQTTDVNGIDRGRIHFLPTEMEKING